MANHLPLTAPRRLDARVLRSIPRAVESTLDWAHSLRTFKDKSAPAVDLTSVASRSIFVLGTLAAVAATSGLPARAVSGRAPRPGPYCAPLRKGASNSGFDFNLHLLDGDGAVFEFSSTRGTAVWLNFCATWCAPCNEECSRIVRLAEHYKPYGLSTIAIDVGEPAQPVRDFRDRYRISFPIAMDPKEIVYRAFGRLGYPTHAFFDREGRVTCIVAGGLELFEMDNEIAVALGGNPVLPAQTPAPDTSPVTPAASPDERTTTSAT